MTVGVETPNALMEVFSNTVTAGFASLQGAVNGVFGLMIVLVVALTGIQWVLSPNREILASAFGKILLIGAFAWLINDWQALSETIYAGFLELGLTAGGGSLSPSEFLNPGAILAQGWQIVKALGETPAPVNNPLDVAGNLTDALILGLAMIGILLAFAVLALQIIVSLLEFKIVTLGGFVLLPFGIWTKTAFLAERPLGYVVSSGLKVLALAIVVSGARTIFDQLQPSTNPDIYEALTILVAAILLAMLAVFIPNLASALVTGGPALGAGALMTGGLAVAGAGALAGAGVAATGALAAGAAGRIGGSVRAAAGANPGRASGVPPAGTGGPGGGRGPGGPSPAQVAPRPSNDNPCPGPTAGVGSARATATTTRRDGAPDAPGVAEPAVAWSVDPGGSVDSARGAPARSAGRSARQVAAEAERARQDFHKAAAGADRRSAPGAGRPAALRAFFAANAGRGLMPAGETSGTLSPNLRSEEP